MKTVVLGALVVVFFLLPFADAAGADHRQATTDWWAFRVEAPNLK